MKYRFTKYGQEIELFKSQKVFCSYYHEYFNKDDAYRRSWLSLLIDRAFKPPKLGVIVGNAGVHPYWLGADGKEQYLFVKFKEHILPKPIPISCIQDAAEYAERTKKMLEREKDRIGEKGYSFESFLTLSKWADEAANFAP